MDPNSIYYAELCPHEPSWVHEQLAEERVRLEREVERLKTGIKTNDVTMIVDGNDMCDWGWSTHRGSGAGQQKR